MNDKNSFFRCDGVSRRDFLHAGLMKICRISIVCVHWHLCEEATHARANACILIWLDGGLSHLDTFDLKPEAPSEIRAFQTYCNRCFRHSSLRASAQDCSHDEACGFDTLPDMSLAIMTRVVSISSLGTNPHRSCATQVWEAFMRMRLPINRFFRPMSPSPKPPSMLAQGSCLRIATLFTGRGSSKPDFEAIRNLRPPPSLTLDRVETSGNATFPRPDATQNRRNRLAG